jgi:hypothetical protein
MWHRAPLALMSPDGRAIPISRWDDAIIIS